MDRSEIRAAVLETVWPWKADQSSLLRESVGKVRLGAVGQGIIGGAVGTAVYFYLSPTVGMVAWVISGLLALIGLISPLGLYSKISSGMESFGRFVGMVLSWLLLVPVYYLFFTPFRLLFRRGKKDAMKRWLDPEASTYWIERSNPLPEPDSYQRQF